MLKSEPFVCPQNPKCLNPSMLKSELAFVRISTLAEIRTFGFQTFTLCVFKVFSFLFQVLKSVQTYLLASSPDDTDSLSTIITIYDVILLSFGSDEDDINDHLDVSEG